VSVRCIGGKGESIVLSSLDIVALDLGIHPNADHKHVVARGEADICGSTCKYVHVRGRVSNKSLIKIDSPCEV
jgi:hypothetical protein